MDRQEMERDYQRVQSPADTKGRPFGAALWFTLPSRSLDKWFCLWPLGSVACFHRAGKTSKQSNYSPQAPPKPPSVIGALASASYGLGMQTPVRFMRHKMTLAAAAREAGDTHIRSYERATPDKEGSRVCFVHRWERFHFIEWKIKTTSRTDIHSAQRGGWEWSRGVKQKVNKKTVFFHNKSTGETWDHRYITSRWTRGCSRMGSETKGGNKKDTNQDLLLGPENKTAYTEM